MKIGLDLDGTVYAHQEFFRALIPAFHAMGHQFFCTSSHARSEWSDDCERLRAIGINPDLISPELMHHVRHGDIHIKGRQADQLDLVFDDDARIQRLTRTPVFCPGNTETLAYNFM